jgi:hypothetical protein
MAHDTKEANRARQKRHRDKKRAVTDALVSRQAQGQLSAAANCVKCNEHGKPCAEHQRLANSLLKKLGHGVNRGSNFARKKTETGDALPTGAPGNHGRAVGAERFTGPQSAVTTAEILEVKEANAIARHPATAELHTVAATFTRKIKAEHPHYTGDQVWDMALQRAYETIWNVKVKFVEGGTDGDS